MSRISNGMHNRILEATEKGSAHNVRRGITDRSGNEDRWGVQVESHSTSCSNHLRHWNIRLSMIALSKHFVGCNPFPLSLISLLASGWRSGCINSHGNCLLEWSVKVNRCDANGLFSYLYLHSAKIRYWFVLVRACRRYKINK